MLYSETKEAIVLLEKMGETEQSKNFADLILNSFVAHNKEEPEILIQWVARNTGVLGCGCHYSKKLTIF